MEFSLAASQEQVLWPEEYGRGEWIYDKRK